MCVCVFACWTNTMFFYSFVPFKHLPRLLFHSFSHIFLTFPQTTWISIKFLLHPGNVTRKMWRNCLVRKQLCASLSHIQIVNLRFWATQIHPDYFASLLFSHFIFFLFFRFVSTRHLSTYDDSAACNESRNRVCVCVRHLIDNGSESMCLFCAWLVRARRDAGSMYSMSAYTRRIFN